MDLARTLAAGLSLNRALFGLNYLARPQEARKSWIGRAAKRPGAQVMIRSQGVPDIALGARALRALRSGDAAEARAWVAGHALCDVTDLVVTWAARDRLPERQSRFAMAVAGASTVVAATAVGRLRS